MDEQTKVTQKAKRQMEQTSKKGVEERLAKLKETHRTKLEEAEVRHRQVVAENKAYARAWAEAQNAAEEAVNPSESKAPRLTVTHPLPGRSPIGVCCCC